MLAMPLATTIRSVADRKIAPCTNVSLANASPYQMAP